MPRRLVLAAVLAAGSACAQDCAGTWDGTVGGAPAMLQFNWDALGAYYLGTALAGAVLRPRDDGPGWDEFDEQGRRNAWLRVACAGRTLAGERTGTGGQRATVQARRVEDTTYNRRRLAAAELVPLRALAENGRVLEVVAVRGFPQLATARIREPRGAGEAAVNERLRAALLQQLDNHLQCQALLRARGQFEQPGGDRLALQRLEWRGSILSVQSWLHGDCGGDQAYAGPQQFTFDTSTGQELPLPQWLRPEYRDGVAAGTPLHQALVLPQVLRGRKALEELPEARRDCAEFELAERAVPLAVEERGMVFGFHYSAVMASCGLSFVLPWPRLADYLSDDGRHWLAAMQGMRQR